MAREVAGHSVASVARYFHREESTLVRGVLKLEREIEGDRRWRREAETVVANLRRSRPQYTWTQSLCSVRGGWEEEGRDEAWHAIG